MKFILYLKVKHAQVPSLHPHKAPVLALVPGWVRAVLLAVPCYEAIAGLFEFIVLLYIVVNHV